MITIGTDSHKKTHTFVAVDDVGRRVGEKTLAATSDGHLALVQWAAQWTQVTFALEDCRHLTRRLERDLLAAGHRVLRVPTKLMAGARRGGREPGKSDPIDAEAVALAALRHSDLPVAELDSPTREVKLLVDHRRDLVAKRTRVHNRLRWHLHELDPTLHVPSRGLRRYCVLSDLAVKLEVFDGVVGRLARELVDRTRQLTEQINALEAELRPIVRRLAPSLLAVPGCGVLSAAMILGETAGVHRFRNKDAYARFTGTAPYPGLVGQHERQRTAQPRRQPHAEHGVAHDRRDSVAGLWTRQGLPGQARQHRQGPHRSHPAAPPPPFRRRVRRATNRWTRPPRTRPTGPAIGAGDGGLT